MDRRTFLKGSAGVTSLALLANSPVALAAWRRRPQVTIKAPTDGRDVTNIILRQIAGAPDGAVIWFPRGRYRCEGSLLIQDRSGLSLRGPATIYSTAVGPLDGQGMSQRRHLWFNRCRNISVKDLHIKSSNLRPNPDQIPGFGAYLAQYEFEHGFVFHECHGVRVRDCSTKGTWGDGLYIGNQRPSTDVRVNGFTVRYNGRQGVAISNADGVLLDNVKIMNTRRAGFDLEPAASTWSVTNVEIRNSYTNGYHIAFPSGGRGDVSNIYLHHNQISGPGGTWVYVASGDGTRRRNWRITDNQVLNALGTPQSVLRFHRVDDISILRNVSPVATTQSQSCLGVEDCWGTLELRDNDFRPGGSYVSAINSAPVLMSGNMFGN